MSPEQRRELIKLANRDRLRADYIQELLNYAELIYSAPVIIRGGEPHPEPEELFALWKESFG